MRLSVATALVSLCGCNAAFGIGDLSFDDPTGSGGAATSGTGGAATGVGGNGDGGSTGVGGAGGRAPSGFSDDGLLVRYFFDDGGAGVMPATALDASPNGVDLSMVYVGGVPIWDTLEGNAGLRWLSPGQRGAAQRLDVVDTPLGVALAGSPTATIEIVARVADVVSTTSRLFDIGQEAQGSLSLGSPTLGTFEARLADQTVATFSATAPDLRHVYHLVVDLNAADTEEMALYADGAPLPTISRNVVTASAIPIAPLDALVIGNHVDENRSIEGFIGYAAIYDTAFDDARIAAHVTRLLASDDP